MVQQALEMTILEKRNDLVKKRCTKKQITEAIAYLEKQLKVGNYCRVNENADVDWT